MENDEIIQQGERYCMATYARYPVAIVRGERARVWDADGREYLDMVGGLAVNALGHAHPALIAALQEQAAQLIHCSNLYWNAEQVKLARRLVELSGLDKAFFCNSGTEANEAAIKLVRKYARQQGKPAAYEIITMERSFHGRTMGALAATGQEKLQANFTPLVPGFRHVPLNDFEALQQAVTDRTAAVMLEPVQGEGGVYVAEDDYLKKVSAFCREHGLLLVLDEVQCGLGRTGRFFAFQHYGVQPDILTLAKALGGGVPVGAMLAREEVAAAFEPGDHGSTFGGNSLVCHVALAVLEVLEGGLVENAARTGAYFLEKLQTLAPKFSCIRQVRGRGLLLGMKLDIPGQPVISAARAEGLLITGAGPQVLRFLPPLIIGPAEVDMAVAMLERALEKGQSEA